MEYWIVKGLTHLPNLQRFFIDIFEEILAKTLPNDLHDKTVFKNIQKLRVVAQKFYFVERI